MIAYWIILFFVQPKVVLTTEQVTVDSVDRQGRNHVFKVGGPIPWSRLLYRTSYGWYTQFRVLQSVP